VRIYCVKAKLDIDALAVESAYPEHSTWKKTLQNVIPAVVSIRVSSVRSFDTERPSTGEASGFVVDKTRGIILTNRHVVTTGPVAATAIFLDHEEVPIYPVYRDPVHDFGFFRFDPKEVKFMELAEIPLAPEEAAVGLEIRVIGNDAGEKLSILSGILARLDRPAPYYGPNDYNDFNTFYYQAASSTSGGSSGSPVISVAGNAVALNAGGKESAATSFYLPLDRVTRALKMLQEEKPIGRGTIQTEFRHQPYNIVSRLGLPQDVEATVRATKPKDTGMLVVHQVLDKGPANGLLEHGDIVLKLNDTLITTFLELEGVLDDSVGRTVEFVVRRGDKDLTVAVHVEDLHQIAPHKFLSISGAVIHNLSYQQAKNYRLPVGGVYLNADGYMFNNAGIYRKSMITAVGNKRVHDLQDLQAALAPIAHGSRVAVRHYSLKEPNREKVNVVIMERKWFPVQEWTRNDVAGTWDIASLAHDEQPPQPQKPLRPKPFPITGKPIYQNIAASLVEVQFTVPYMIDGSDTSHYSGVGLIVDSEQGLVVVDKTTVPHALGDCHVTFGASATLNAQVLFSHPTHNFSVIKYDTSLLQGGHFKSCKINYDHKFVQGENVHVVGFANGNLFGQQTIVSRVEEFFVGEYSTPCFRPVNEEVIQLEKAPTSSGGVMIDEEGSVIAFWGCYYVPMENSIKELFRGFPVKLIQPVVKPLAAAQTPHLRSLEVEWWPISLSDARDMGLSDEWISVLEEQGARRQVMKVRKIMPNTHASKELKPGDLLLSIGKRVIGTFQDIEEESQHADHVTATVFSDGNVHTTTLHTHPLHGLQTDLVLFWAGVLIQPSPRAAVERGFAPEGVYLSRKYYGSPADIYGLRPTWWITHLNDVPVPTINHFIDTVKTFDKNSHMRVKMVSMMKESRIMTLKPDYHYWPTTLFRFQNYQWLVDRNIL
jgi:S1-C subfamily serine protease